MQALHKLALAPIAETTADRNSYGFREGRSCHDAIAAGFDALSKPNSATWILEGDIKGCFDNFSHQWMFDHIPMDKQVLSKWLKAGYIEEGQLYPSRKGTPQGGIISPTLSNMALDGMAQAIHSVVPPRNSRVNFVRYADDFIVTAKSKRLLDEHVKPAIETFLATRGLKLSEEKTVITHITQGFTFLGQSFRKQGNVLHIIPSQTAVLSIINKLGEMIHRHVSAPMAVMIKKLNDTLRGWGNYHRFVVSSRAFGKVDSYIIEQLWRMLRKRHPNKSKKWLIPRYWQAGGRDYRFAVKRKTKSADKVDSVIRLADLKRTRYVKIKADANPYLQKYAGYYYDRRHKRSKKELGALSARAYRSGNLRTQQ